MPSVILFQTMIHRPIHGALQSMKLCWLCRRHFQKTVCKELVINLQFVIEFTSSPWWILLRCTEQAFFRLFGRFRWSSGWTWATSIGWKLFYHPKHNVVIITVSKNKIHNSPDESQSHPRSYSFANCDDVESVQLLEQQWCQHLDVDSLTNSWYSVVRHY